MGKPPTITWIDEDDALDVIRNALGTSLLSALEEALLQAKASGKVRTQKGTNVAEVHLPDLRAWLAGPGEKPQYASTDATRAPKTHAIQLAVAELFPNGIDNVTNDWLVHHVEKHLGGKGIIVSQTQIKRAVGRKR